MFVLLFRTCVVLFSHEISSTKKRVFLVTSPVELFAVYRSRCFLWSNIERNRYVRFTTKSTDEAQSQLNTAHIYKFKPSKVRSKSPLFYKYVSQLLPDYTVYIYVNYIVLYKSSSAGKKIFLRRAFNLNMETIQFTFSI